MKGPKLKNVALAKLFDLLIPSPDPVDGKDRAAYERMAIPHAFKPRLSFFEALIAVFAALVRIILGSLLFAVWGAYSLKLWTTLPNVAIRFVVLLPMLVLFLLSFALIMIAITAGAKFITHKHV